MIDIERQRWKEEKNKKGRKKIHVQNPLSQQKIYIYWKIHLLLESSLCQNQMDNCTYICKTSTTVSEDFPQYANVRKRPRNLDQFGFGAFVFHLYVQHEIFSVSNACWSVRDVRNCMYLQKSCPQISSSFIYWKGSRWNELFPWMRHVCAFALSRCVCTCLGHSYRRGQTNLQI